MRAMAIVGGFGLDHLKLIERPIPEPRHSEVVIRIFAVSLNYRDMDMVLGTYPFSFPLPLVPTSDGVGEVVAVGEGVTRAKVGDRVLGTFHQSWIAGRYEEGTPQLGGSVDGMLAEYVCLDRPDLCHRDPALAPPAETFAKGRDFAAWLGLTPLQRSTGGKRKLGATSKMGERTLRRLLIIGSSAVVLQASKRGAPKGSWLEQMLGGRRMSATVALANKMARIVWALLVKQGNCRAPVAAKA